MGVFLQEAVRALPAAVVRVVQLGGYDPVPAELFEVDDERVPAAAHLLGAFGAVHADVSARAPV